MPIEKIFPLIIDNTMVGAVKKCQKSAYWQFERGLKLADLRGADLIAGGAFAAGVAAARLAFYRDNESDTQALDKGLKALDEAYGNPKLPPYTVKTKDRMYGALVGYFVKWPLLRTGLLPFAFEFDWMIEQAIHAPLGPYEYGGKFDALMQDENGVLWIVDEKTTGKISESWLESWDLDSQMTGYLWLVKQIFRRHEVGGAIIRGVGIGRDEPTFVEVQVRRNDWEIERWAANTVKLIADWDSVSRLDDYRMALDWQCGRCAYSKLCKVREPELLVADNYRMERWEPFASGGKDE